MIKIREIDQAGMADVSAIDVAECGEERYQFVDGELSVFQQTWQRPFWDEEAWQQRLAAWKEKLKPDLYLGAYDGKRMVGIAGLRYRLTPTMAQLTSLYIDRHYRRQGVAHQLTEEIFRLSRESRAQAIYVTSKPSVPAVGFYLRHGFQPTHKPDPALYAALPLDIHMVRTLGVSDGDGINHTEVTP